MSATSTQPLTIADFEIGKKIGEGGFGIVHLWTLKGTNKKVAIKTFSIEGTHTVIGKDGHEERMLPLDAIIAAKREIFLHCPPRQPKNR